MKAELSTVTELKNVVGHRLYADVFRLCPDKREIFETAAWLLEISEVEIVIKMAERLKLPVLTRLTDDFEFVEVPGVTLEEHLERAFVLFRSKTGFYGAACLNPAWLTPYTNRFNQFPTLLASWGVIKSWIKRQEQTAAKQNILIQSLSLKCHSRLSAEKAIDAIIEVVSSLGVSAAALQFMSNIVRYEVIGSDLRTHCGEIRTREAERVEEILALSLLKHPHQVERRFNGQRISITVSPNPIRRKFYIHWEAIVPKVASY